MIDYGLKNRVAIKTNAEPSIVPSSGISRPMINVVVIVYSPEPL